MNYRKHGAKLLGLLAVAALGAMALAASAQAVPLEKAFFVNGAAVGALVATVGAEQEGTGSLLVSGLNFKLTCGEFSVDEGVINSNSDAKAVLLYKKCTTLEFNSPFNEIPCHVAEPIKAEALILPTEMLKEAGGGEPLPYAILAEKIKALIRLWETNAAKPLTNECTLPNDNVVTGELCLKIDPTTNHQPVVRVTTDVDIQKLCKPKKELNGGSDTEGSVEEPAFPILDKLVYGGQEVFVDGAAKLKLTGAHEGKTLGVLLI